VDHLSILTISEAEGFIEQSGMINLVSEQKSAGSQVVSFEINQAAAEKANLRFDTQLLKLARRTKS
jgi:mitochondrial fission protein ELM1